MAVPPGPLVQWAPEPQNLPPNCPPGLSYLLQVDQLLVKQQIELLEAFTGFETGNKYLVLNTAGQQVFYAAEESGCLSRNCCGPLREFDMVLLDNSSQEVARFRRPFKCTGRCFICWCPCQLQEMEITAGGVVIGKIQQIWDIKSPIYNICDAQGQTVLKIVGPVCAVSCCNDINFEVMTTDGNVVGMVQKKFGGVAQELFTDADNFGITFPMDLDVRVKAVLLAATFLIDLNFFEDKNGANTLFK